MHFIATNAAGMYS